MTPAPLEALRCTDPVMLTSALQSLPPASSTAVTRLTPQCLKYPAHQFQSRHQSCPMLQAITALQLLPKSRTHSTAFYFHVQQEVMRRKTGQNTKTELAGLSFDTGAGVVAPLAASCQHCTGSGIYHVSPAQHPVLRMRVVKIFQLRMRISAYSSAKALEVQRTCTLSGLVILRGSQE